MSQNHRAQRLRRGFKMRSAAPSSEPTVISPLDYATPEFDKKPPFPGDVSIIVSAMPQLFVAVMLMFFVPANRISVREGTWYATAAYYFTTSAFMLGLIEAVCTVFMLYAAFQRPKSRRWWPYLVYAAVVVMVSTIPYAASRILDASPVYVSSLPVTVPVNNERYRPTTSNSPLLELTSWTFLANPMFLVLLGRTVSPRVSFTGPN